MKIPYLTLFFVFLVNLLVDWYLFRVLRSELRNRLWSKIQFVSAIIFAVGLLVLFFIPLNRTSDTAMRGLMWCIFVYVSVYVPKYIYVIFDIVSRIPRLWHHHGWKVLRIIGAVLSAIIFLALWWGALINRFNIDVEEVDVDIDQLPAAFDGFRIAQISDLHVGTYGNDTTFLSKLVTEINDLHPDIVFFTGDIVNRRSSELEPFVSTLSRINAPYGVFSILGNHDYGDYYQWPDTTAQMADRRNLVELQKEMGWNLLKNKHKFISAEGDSLLIIGVENIGDPPFHVYGNLKDAYPTPADHYTKILLSHTPAHWVWEIADSDKNIALTLSGHTHAMQISVLGFSPAVTRYRTWGGLYSDTSKKHKLYVNRGIGTVGFPARIGATPEITLLTLRRSDGEDR